MKILIVEDSKTDRELLRFLIEERFKSQAKFREAATLETAFGYLRRGDIDCIILDLNLPDSVGKETFRKLYTKYPDIPIVVMTNSKDIAQAEALAIEGAADYIEKGSTDEEAVFQRIILAIAKHKTTIRVHPEEARTMHRLDNARARMQSAHDSGEHKAIETTTRETTTAIADLSKHMFTELQKLHIAATRQETRQEQIWDTVDALRVEVLEGHPNSLSLKAQVESLDQRMEDLEGDFKTEATAQQEHFSETRRNRIRIVVAIIAALGTAGGAAAGGIAAYKAAIEVKK